MNENESKLPVTSSAESWRLFRAYADAAFAVCAVKLSPAPYLDHGSGHVAEPRGLGAPGCFEPSQICFCEFQTAAGEWTKAGLKSRSVNEALEDRTCKSVICGVTGCSHTPQHTRLLCCQVPAPFVDFIFVLK